MLLNKTSKIFLILFSCLILVQCNSSLQESPREKQSPRIRKQIKLISPKGNTKITPGEKVIITVQHREDQKIDSMIVRYEGKEQVVRDSTYTLSTENARMGRLGLSVTAYSDDLKESLLPKVTVLAERKPTEYAYRILKEYPHDPDAWTQGLFFIGDTLYESTGNESRKNLGSTMRKSILTTGEVIKNVPLENRFFGEGCTMWDEKIYQLTWKSRTALIYNRNLDQISTLQYATEGWGLITLGDTLILSDGSENLYLLDPRDLSEIDIIQVYDDRGKVTQINEMELVEGQIFANIWQKDEIVIIDPSTGQVTGRVDFKGIIDRNKYNISIESLNGIAYHEDGRLFVTGKWWPSLYEIEIIPKPNT
jgi:glutamine cyclotransferase